MSRSRLELKVGAFVLLGLVLVALLTLLFSKGTAFYQHTVGLRLKASNVGGIKTGANVQVSGVSVGRVSGVELDPDGKGVTIFLKIFQKYKIYSDARFEIEQFGFLGYQYVAIYPGDNDGPLLKDGDEVHCQNPFNMQEAVATATETLTKIGNVTSNLNAAVTDVRRFVLTEQTLTNLSGSIERFGLLTSSALGTVSNLNALVATNTLPVTEAVSNLNGFAAQLSPLAERVNQLVATNADEINATMKNLESASLLLTNLLHDLQNGPGLAARLLHDEAMASNVSALTYNLSVTSSNLNRRGLWGILWSQKPPQPATPPKSAIPGGHSR